MKRSNPRPAHAARPLHALAAAGLLLCAAFSIWAGEARAQEAAVQPESGGAHQSSAQQTALLAPSSAPAGAAYGLALQPVKVAYAAHHLSLDSENTSVAEALLAISHATGLQIESSYDSPEHFPAHYSGTEQQVVNALLDSSDCGFVIVPFSTDPTTIEKVVITRLYTVAPSGSQGAETRTSLDPRMERVAKYVPPESVAERRGESVLDIQKPAPREDSAPDEAHLRPVLPAATDGFAGSSVQPSIGSAAGEEKHADDQKVSAQGRYMQELYKSRLQQQQQNAPTAPVQ